MKRALVFVVLVFLLIGVNPAKALLCNFSVSDVAFGDVEVLAGGAIDTTSTVSINCVGVAFTSTRVCLNLNAGSGGADASGRYMTGSGGSLRYQLYQNAARTVIWGSTTWGLTGGPVQIDVPIGLSLTGSASVTIYGRVFAPQPAAGVGNYSSVFSGSQAVFAYAAVGLFDCSTIFGLPPLTANPTFNVTAKVVDHCLVNALNINFGSRGVLNTNTDANGRVDVTCTLGTNYSVGLNGGNAGAPPGARKMAKGAETITYGLYQNMARSTLWGNTQGVDAIAGSGTGVAQNRIVYGRVPAQPTPTSGTYTDTVVVTVTY